VRFAFGHRLEYMRVCVENEPFIGKIMAPISLEEVEEVTAAENPVIDRYVLFGNTSRCINHDFTTSTWRLGLLGYVLSVLLAMADCTMLSLRPVEARNGSSITGECHLIELCTMSVYPFVRLYLCACTDICKDMHTRVYD